MTTDHGLNINNLSMRFDLPNGGSVQALKNVNLHLKSGETDVGSGSVWMWKKPRF